MCVKYDAFWFTSIGMIKMEKCYMGFGFFKPNHYGVLISWLNYNDSMASQKKTKLRTHVLLFMIEVIKVWKPSPYAWVKNGNALLCLINRFKFLFSSYTYENNMKVTSATLAVETLLSIHLVLFVYCTFARDIHYIQPNWQWYN